MDKNTYSKVLHVSSDKEASGGGALWGQTETCELGKKGYSILFQAGKGATSQVYCVKSDKSGKNYACKISTRIDLLEREAALMKELSHPLFPAFIEFWQAEGFSFLLMEYITGECLSDLLKRRGRLSQRMAVSTALELAEGLKYLQELDPPVVYRDLKPGNILVQNSGRIRLTDLGAACQVGNEAVTREGEYAARLSPRIRAGTPGFAAPEQWKAKHVDERADIFAMGMVLIYMLTGVTPDERCPSGKRLPGQSSAGSPEAVLSVRAHHVRIRRELDCIIKACTAARIEERIPSMRELIRRLLDFRDRGAFQIFFKEINCLCHTDRRKTVYYVRNVWKTAGRVQ